MVWFLRWVVSGFAIGIGFIVAMFTMGYAAQYYYSHYETKHPLAFMSNEALKAPLKNDDQREAVSESYDNEKLDQIYAKAEKYRWGVGVNKNNEEAAKYYLLAAEHNHIKSQMALARLFIDGYGVNQNYGEAIKWYKAASNLGSTEATGGIGWMYLNGYGVSKDYKLAFDNLMLAANDGHGFAMGNIGYMYELGLFVDRNDGLARQWYEKGKLAGDDYSYRKIRDGWQQIKAEEFFCCVKIFP